MNTSSSTFSNANAANARRYESYIVRRKQGSPREPFPNHEYAVQWLRLPAVVKYVDGGWLADVLNFSTYHQGVQERRAAKLASQVMSEEFGDGDLSKNHVHIYNGLLKRLDGAASTGDEPGFDGLSKDERIPRCWIAAVAQQ